MDDSGARYVQLQSNEIITTITNGRCLFDSVLKSLNAQYPEYVMFNGDPIDIKNKLPKNRSIKSMTLDSFMATLRAYIKIPEIEQKIRREYKDINRDTGQLGYNEIMGAINTQGSSLPFRNWPSTVTIDFLAKALGITIVVYYKQPNGTHLMNTNYDTGYTFGNQGSRRIDIQYNGGSHYQAMRVGPRKIVGAPRSSTQSSSELIDLRNSDTAITKIFKILNDKLLDKDQIGYFIHFIRDTNFIPVISSSDVKKAFTEYLEYTAKMIMETTGEMETDTDLAIIESQETQYNEDMSRAVKATSLEGDLSHTMVLNEEEIGRLLFININIIRQQPIYREQMKDFISYYENFKRNYSMTEDDIISIYIQYLDDQEIPSSVEIDLDKLDDVIQNKKLTRDFLYFVKIVKEYNEKTIKKRKLLYFLDMFLTAYQEDADLRDTIKELDTMSMGRVGTFAKQEDLSHIPINPINETSAIVGKSSTMEERVVDTYIILNNKTDIGTQLKLNLPTFWTHINRWPQELVDEFILTLSTELGVKLSGDDLNKQYEQFCDNYYKVKSPKENYIILKSGIYIGNQIKEQLPTFWIFLHSPVKKDNVDEFIISLCSNFENPLSLDDLYRLYIRYILTKYNICSKLKLDEEDCTEFINFLKTKDMNKEILYLVEENKDFVPSRFIFFKSMNYSDSIRYLNNMVPEFMVMLNKEERTNREEFIKSITDRKILKTDLDVTYIQFYNSRFVQGNISYVCGIIKQKEDNIMCINFIIYLSGLPEKINSKSFDDRFIKDQYQIFLKSQKSLQYKYLKYRSRYMKLKKLKI